MIWLALVSLAFFTLALIAPLSPRGHAMWVICCLIASLTALIFAMDLTTAQP